MPLLQCAINGRSGSGEAYFFCGESYIVFDWNRSTTDHAGSSFKGRAVSGPHRIDEMWVLPLDMPVSGTAASLDAGLSGDAGGSPQFANKMYFFKDASYARYDYSAAPVRTAETAGSLGLWNLPSDFTSAVRGALNGKRSRLGSAYFFKGSSYSRYNWAADRADLGYPKPILSLINMPQMFWSGIDAAIDGYGDFSDFGYLFRDESYCRFNWVDVKVDNGPHRVWENWPGVLEMLLAAEARPVALTWLKDAREQIAFYIAFLRTGIPSPGDAALMERALQTHFHIPTSMPSDQRLALLDQIRQMLERLERLEDRLGRLGEVLVFHDDGEVKAHNPSFVESDGRAGFGAYTLFGVSIFLTSRFFRRNDTFSAAAVLIHEAVHFLDSMADALRDSPEWYLTGQLRLTAPVLQGGVEVQVEVQYYDQLTAADAIHNPSSYSAFSQHIHFTTDRRLGREVPRPGY